MTIFSKLQTAYEMVSTRGPRSKFAEGERVLCYEPDPTKAKVLYDSKVLEVKESKDKRGKRLVEYIIHFQGWNSSWDRCVSEDFVLKDTEENRELQKELAEKSQLQLGAYLYRKDRKKGHHGGGPSKRTRSSGFEDDGSSSSTQPDDGEIDTDSSSGSYSVPIAFNAQLPLSQSLKDRLSYDYHLVVKRGRLVWLPQRPCVVEVLQIWAQHAAKQIVMPQQKRTRPVPSLSQSDPLIIGQKINMVREVADGLRIYFDLILSGHLLYRQEVRQYRDIVRAIKGRSGSDYEEQDSQQYADPMSEYNENHADELKREEKLFNNHHDDHKNFNSVYGNEDPSSASQPVNEVTRRLRSRATLNNLNQNCNSSPRHTSSTPPPQYGNASPRSNPERYGHHAEASTSSHEEANSTRRITRRAAGSTENAKLNLLIQRIDKWELISREDTAHLPCRIYGPIHLLRMFVKLPEFLSAVQMPDTKLKLLLKHISLCAQFLEDHQEWFGESHYSSENAEEAT